MFCSDLKKMEVYDVFSPRFPHEEIEASYACFRVMDERLDTQIERRFCEFQLIIMSFDA